MAFFTIPAMAQNKTIIKLAWTSGDGATDPYAVGGRAFKEALEKTAGDRIEVRLFPNRQLGDEKPALEGIRLGTVDAGIITNAVVAQIEPTFQLNDMPFLFANEAQAQAVLDGPIGKKLAAKLDAKGIKLLGFMEGGFRNMVNNVRPVAKPEDVKGVKFRVMQNPVYIAMFSSLGGNAVPMAWGETFTAVQQGAIDGLEIPLAVIEQNKVFEITKYLSLTNHTYSAIHLIMNKRLFERLPPDLQKAVVEAGAVATAKQRARAAEVASEIVGKLKAHGMTVNPVADFTPFRESVQHVYKQFEPSIGADLLKETLAAVK
jgi:tripartite ATP-independent transporter DctP family solute receptor